MTVQPPTLAEIEAARAGLDGVARPTPVLPSATLSARAGRTVLLKAELLQRTGSFKIRGAVTRVRALGPEERRAGVVAASAGNHGQSVAWAARELGVPATVFMPLDAPLSKVEATRDYGAEVVFSGGMLDDALERARERVAETGATFLHPFDDPIVVAGQGTIGLELDEQLSELETLVVPLGGGGLASGIALALAERRPGLRIVGVQAERCAPFVGSREHGPTIADGIAVKRPGALTEPIVRRYLADIVTVSDEEIAEAIVVLAERAKLVAEGAGAAPVAALLAGRVGGSGTICCLLSGGNIDASLLAQVARHGLTRAGRHLVVRTQVPDTPGQLALLLTRLADDRVNVIEVGHLREGIEIPVTATGIELTLLTRDHEHCAQVIARMREWGYPTERVR